jgi:hypothetical protein
MATVSGIIRRTKTSLTNGTCEVGSCVAVVSILICLEQPFKDIGGGCCDAPDSKC